MLDQQRNGLHLLPARTSKAHLSNMMVATQINNTTTTRMIPGTVTMTMVAAAAMGPTMGGNTKMEIMDGVRPQTRDIHRSKNISVGLALGHSRAVRRGEVDRRWAEGEAGPAMVRCPAQARWTQFGEGLVPTDRLEGVTQTAHRWEVEETDPVPWREQLVQTRHVGVPTPHLEDPFVPLADVNLAHRGRPPMNGGMSSPGDSGFGGGNYPPYSGPPRRGDFEDERQMVDRMGGMDISQRPPPTMGRGRGGPPRGPPRGPPQVYDGRRPGPSPGYGGPGRGDYGQDYDDGYGGAQGPPRDDFGPPSRSMTMPVNDGMPRRGPGGPPQRMDSMPYGPPPNRGMPPRPSTSQGNRPPANRMYPPNPGLPPQGGYNAPEYDDVTPTTARHRARASFDAAFDAYPGPGGLKDAPALDNMPPSRSRASLDLHLEPGLPQGPASGPGPAGRGQEMTRTKSQPDLRKQAGVFEMPGDAPPMPLPPPPTGYAPNMGQAGYQGGPAGQYDYGGPGPAQLNVGRRPSGAGLPSTPAAAKGQGGLPRGPSPAQSASSNPDALPSHPTPVRPGLMADSMVSMASNKPAPVRNYAASPALSMSSTPSASTSAAPSMMSTSMGPPSTPTPQPQEAPVTEDELERLRMTVKGDPGDQASALKLSERLVEASDILVAHIPDPKARGRLRERYLADAHKILKKLSSAGNMDAMFFFADSLGRGLFSNDPDDKEAFTLYQSAAKLGHAKAAYRTAVCCELGHEERGGTRKDPLKAIQWYKRAATLGDPPAMYKMGIIQLKGLLGQPKNPREAVGWLKRAAERSDSENPHALHELGLLYESAQPNDVILRDEQYAFTLFRKAAELGYKFSQFRLGCAYEYGLMGCPIDPRLSVMWYSKAAMQEEHQSELALSGWYLTGTEGVVQQSDTEAYLWARKAATAGLAKAEYAMGYFTEVGIGVPANMEDAKRWYWRAAGMYIFPRSFHLLHFLLFVVAMLTFMQPRASSRRERGWKTSRGVGKMARGSESGYPEAKLGGSKRVNV